ncbi:MAG: hypothetical protein SGCHY_002398, partial [Lobulomycetales sp.]
QFDDPEYTEKLENFYWKNLTYESPSYGADMVGSLFERSKSGGSWNLYHLDNLLNKVEPDLPGVNVPYLYFGQWKASFPWHVEDMDLYSINYIHFGSPKQWYVIPPEHADRFERFAASIYSKEANRCPQFLRHKACIISPSLLQRNSIPVSKIVHRQGEFMITYPKGYHQGFNLGFNCAESVNFALERWIPIGIKAKHCRCINDSVKLEVSRLFAQDPLLASRPNVKRKPIKVFEVGNSGKRVRYAKENVAARKKVQGPVCILCGHPGPEGSLKICDFDGKLAHLECGYGVPECHVAANPEDPSGPMMVFGVSSIPRGRWNLKCDICKLAKTGKGTMTAGAPIQCLKGACKRAFHVSCAAREYPSYAYNDETGMGECFCPQHDPALVEARRSQAIQQKESEALTDFSTGCLVKVKWGGFFYQGNIVQNLKAEKACMVDFDEGLVIFF